MERVRVIHPIPSTTSCLATKENPSSARVLFIFGAPLAGDYTFKKMKKEKTIVKTALQQIADSQRNLYRTMHTASARYRVINQGLYVVCDWLHLLRDKDGIVHDPWTDEPKPISVIELGCGNGILCNLLSDIKVDVTGVDIFDNKLIYDRSKYLFVEHDLSETPYPFKDNEFDYCVSFDVLEHLPEDEMPDILKEMARISGSGIIVKMACSGCPPLHITVKNQDWWFEQLQQNCPEFAWKQIRIYKKQDHQGRDVYAPMFYGRGV